MVNFSTITEANNRFSNGENNAGLVCVFTGATSGIGAGALERMATMVQESTFYVLGRSPSRFAAQKAKLESLNPKLNTVFLEAEVSLISSIDEACKKITAVESKIDFLYMSQGCFPINVPQYTKEGLDLCFAIQYYCRMRLTSNLLPLLRSSPRPRILSVLSGGNEAAILTTDLGLQNPANYSWSQAINHTVTLTTLSFEYLASNPSNEKITFMHSYPGLVRTNIFTRLAPAEDAGLLSWVLTAFMAKFAWFMQFVLGTSVKASGARQAFLLAGEKFGPGEAWRIDEKCEAVTKTGVLEQYREGGWRQKIWDFTGGAIEKALGASD